MFKFNSYFVLTILIKQISIVQFYEFLSIVQCRDKQIFKQNVYRDYNHKVIINKVFFTAPHKLNK